MGIQTQSFQLTPEWVKLIEGKASSKGEINYEAFSDLALFHPEYGYYTNEVKKRVGKTTDEDFYTASSHQEVFPELIVEAAKTLLEQNGFPPDSSTLYEIGAEPGSDPWKSLNLPFRDYRIWRFGEPLEFCSPAVVYSNELFDAQPFHRWLAVEGKWHPIHLQLKGSGLFEILAEGPISDEESACLALLPPAPEMDYHLDISTQAVKLLQCICKPDWKGVFIAFDYGMMWNQLSQETPQGTARAYKQQRQHNDLYATPGEQDLTTHVCWNHLMQALTSCGFTNLQLKTQSRFLMETATQRIQSIVTTSHSLIDKRKSQLLELISPGFFGQKFQVLSGIRK